jgi:hypothetical protein
LVASSRTGRKQCYPASSKASRALLISPYGDPECLWLQATQTQHHLFLMTQQKPDPNVTITKNFQRRSYTLLWGPPDARGFVLQVGERVGQVEGHHGLRFFGIATQE